MSMQQRLCIWTMAAGLALAAATAAPAQQDPGTSPDLGLGRSSPSPAASQTPSMPSVVPPDVGTTPEMERNQAKMRNLDRQKQLVADTDKLVALANQLKAEVDKSTKDTLSIDVIRKADEIEKLAHNVKEKMKGY